MRSRADLTPGIVLLAFGILVIVESQNISYTNLIGNDPLTPATAPTALGVLLSVLSIGLIVRSLARRQAPVSTVDAGEVDDTEPVPRWRAAQVGIAIVACVGYAVLLPRLGFVITTPLLVAALIAVAVGRERPVVTTLIAILLPAACYLLFIAALGLDLPVWPGGGPMR
ncbi:MAG TPA: tripartite tricarboxylate transporter TctB family protein [Kribbella sp.]|uniref:tripartite tricarboxylate transporter TctB family protein n=1 Tax=Kribbella sp. TaxID=1871183 RepID=UPI002D78619C|nr:tripartite tricarboxylate transporter TctB family protein [Kribbella sp.]HET6294726.1 tripartite tricarboxylate transporter TctB family protein [Kribbella sp.]